MISKWYKLKEEAVKMRLAGNSIIDVEIKLGIPRSTLSGWFKNVKIQDKHKKVLERRWKEALIKARKKAVKWHNKQKALRMITAEKEAGGVIKNINFSNVETMELALSMLYLGEGFKNKSGTGIGNSDPMILSFFIKTLEKLYGIEPKDITCNLHLRADQDPLKLNLYWSRKLDIPIENFRKASLDKRTIGSKTYDSYNGVCVVKCGNVAIQRKLVYLSRIYCEKIIMSLGG